MREMLSLATVKFIAVLTGLVAMVAIAVTLPLLAWTVSDLSDTVDGQSAKIEQQDRELECRATDAAELDVLRSEISLELSRGLVQVVREDDAALNATIQRIEVLQTDLEAAAERRQHTVERCQRP